MDHISICICTYKRPNFLKHLLLKLQEQQTEGLFTYSVVVVDNDYKQTAKRSVESFMKSTKIDIDYYSEPEQNIALARNKAVENAHGNYIAFIDDDEHPVDDWLAKMYKCQKILQVDGVLGPVLPYFLPGAPAWLIKSGFCERRRHSTGFLITTKDVRTGNILLLRSIFEKNDKWFDPARGRTGGEDSEFLERQMKKGYLFVWCDEAPVFESVTEQRWSAAFYLKREFRIGTLAGEEHRQNRSISTPIRDYIVLSCLLFIMPLSFLTPKYIGMKVLTKLSYTVGRLLSYCGLSLLRYRQ